MAKSGGSKGVKSGKGGKNGQLTRGWPAKTSSGQGKPTGPRDNATTKKD